MGINDGVRGPEERGSRTLNPDDPVRVVPDVATLAVDDGFLYRASSSLSDRVRVGSIVRVPLGGRKVRGYVVGTDRDADIEDAGSIKEIRTLSSEIPVFTEAMLPTLAWVARHYVAPTARVLTKTAPPNLPKQPADTKLPSIPPATGRLADIGRGAARGSPGPPVQVLSGWDWAEVIRQAITSPLRAQKSVVVMAPTAVEATQIARSLRANLGSRVVEADGQTASQVTEAWSRAASIGGLAIIGTMRVGWWPAKDLSMIVLVEEGRRGMKERQTPTVSAERLAVTRATYEKLQILKVGRIPTLASVHAGVEVLRMPGRLWGPVQLVDRTEDPPGQGLLAERVRAAIHHAATRKRRVLVFTHRRGYAPAARCVSCRSLRSCPHCGTRPDNRPFCPRCQAELGECHECGGNRFEPLGAAVGRVVEVLRGLVGNEPVGRVDQARQIMVGSEADLVAVPPVDLAVVVDADGLVMGHNYRATEDALALLARVAATVRRNGKARMMLQTADLRHPVYRALATADPSSFLKEELALRRNLSLPPAGEVMVVEVEGTEDETILEDVMEGAIIFGPGRSGNRLRWIVQSDDLTNVKGLLRERITLLRRRRLKVRVDVDPREF